jgi:hypothetical protein
MALPPIPPRDEQTSERNIAKPRRTEGWALAVGALILVALLGHLLNQQRTSRRTPDAAAVEPPRRESPPAPAPKTPPSDPTRRDDGGSVTPAAPARVTYIVTHKHRLRDCHGTLTFTRNGLRFDSDEPQDSFDVGRDDVMIEGDALRIRDKLWRFEFRDAIPVERLFSGWKAGNLPAAPTP